MLAADASWRIAAAQEQGASAAAMRDAFLVGSEAACHLGMVLGDEHYQRGFIQTATAGAFGATEAESSGHNGKR